MSKETIREPFTMYGGEVKGYYIDSSHQYWISHLDGEEVKKHRPTSVSAISGKLDKSPQLIWWAVKTYTERVTELMGEGENFTRDDIISMLSIGQFAHKERKEEAAGIGTYVHKWAEEYAKDQDSAKAYERMESSLGVMPEIYRERVNNGVVGLQKWFTDNDVKFIKSECLVYSKKHRYIGRFDAILEINGNRYLSDFKTSNEIYIDHKLQSAGYLEAYEEEHDDVLDGTAIIAISKEDKYDKDGNIIKRAGDIEVHFENRDVVSKLASVFTSLAKINETLKNI